MNNNDNRADVGIGTRDNLSERIASLSPAKRALLELRIKQLESRPAAGTSVPRRGTGEPCPLSFSQQRLWFLQEFDPNSPVYNITRAIRLKGSLNIEALRRALNAVVERHEILRTTIKEVEGSAIQFVCGTAPVPLPLFDLSELRESDRAEEVRRFVAVEAQKPFDLSSELMLRAALIRIENDEHVLILATHHIASDGWSSNLLLRDIAAYYGAACQGKAAALPELPVQYADFALWQRNTLNGETLSSQLTYWKEQLQRLPGVLSLPSDHPRPSVQSFRGARVPIHVRPDLTLKLRKLSQGEGATLFMLLLAAFKTLLFRSSGQEDMVVGVPVANRNRPELENLVGFFVNNLVLRTDLGGDPTFRELVARVREVALGAYAHQDVPFEKLVEELQPERNLSHTPLFQVMFGFQNLRKDSVEFPGLAMSPVEIENGTAKFDLFLSLVEDKGSLRGTLEYNTDIFEEGTISRMVNHYLILLDGVCARPDSRLSKLPLLTDQEKNQLLVDWSRTQTEEAHPYCIHRMFELQVEKSPDATALIFEDQQLTYRELNQRANQLARYLRGLGVAGEVLVGISMERSIDMVVAVLGVLKAGGAYVPLDPAYPPDRLQYMVQDSEISVLLTQGKLREVIPANDAKVICLDSEWNRVGSEGRNNLDELTEGGNLAYVIYTSGSTGRPKGVQITHSAVVNFLLAMIKQPGMNANDVLAAVTTLSFDIAGLEIFLPLTCGARVVVVSADVATQAVPLAEILERHEVTVMQATPATWRMLLEAGWQGRRKLKVLCGGEMLPRVLADRLLEKTSGLWNMYGPTETTIWSTIKLVEPANGAVSIGRPIDNTRVYIVDAHCNPVPIGVQGELYIGGAGVARGYRNRPELVAEKFVPDPFGSEPGARLYKTGDLARFLPDGTIECLGRTDHQVKLRGFRIELGEIESVLSQHPTVQHAVVIDQEISGDKRLVGYVVADNSGTNQAELKTFLRSRLPVYMVPASFVFLDGLPLTPNGKVDRRALPAPEQIGAERGNGFLAPRDAGELQLAGVWGEVLGVKPIGIRDNFFELGGHSLLAVRLFAQIEKSFGKKLPLATLFQAPDIESFAKLLHQAGWSPSWSSLVPIQPKGSRLPFFCVHAHGGNVLNFNELARCLGPDQPFYGLQAQGLDGSRPRHTSVEEMASHYIREVRQVQARGPYLLGGYCFGGKVAFEMAQQLRNQGEEVALVALIDAFAPGYRTLLPWALRRLEQVKFHWRNLRQSSDRVKYILEKGSLAITQLEKFMKIVATRVFVGLRLPLPAPLAKALEQKQPRVRFYRPSIYPGTLTIFAPADSDSHYRRFESHLGWKGLSWKLDVRVVPGIVAGLMSEPYVSLLALELSASIDAATAVTSARQHTRADFEAVTGER